jgi:putative N6-adenine-specific DNA methylase
LKTGTETIFAVTAPGLEGVCAGELARLGVSGIQPVVGGVEFEGALDDLYRANLCLRSASRLLVRLGEIRARDFPDLFGKAKRLPWGKFIRPATALEVRSTSRGSRLVHTGRIGETIAAAADRALGRRIAPVDGITQQVLARFENDLCQISIDSSGELLHRRGYRRQTMQAPLRETLAAGLLLLLGWDGRMPLVDPMCGSGTLVIEGALLARQLPPGGHRTFACMEWPGFRPGLWQAVLTAALRQTLPAGPIIVGADRDAAAIAVASDNAGRAGVLSDIELRRHDLAEMQAPAGPGLLLCNPPYGARLAAGEDLRPLFRKLGTLCHHSFAGWQIAFLAPDEKLAQATGLSPTPLAYLSNGGIPVKLFHAVPG